VRGGKNGLVGESEVARQMARPGKGRGRLLHGGSVWSNEMEGASQLRATVSNRETSHSINREGEHLLTRVSANTCRRSGDPVCSMSSVG